MLGVFLASTTPAAVTAAISASAVAIAGLGGGWFAARRLNSGKVRTSDATTLWSEAEKLRGVYRDEAVQLRLEAVQLRLEAQALRDEALVLREEAATRRREAVEWRREAAQLRSESATLRAENVAQREELARLRAAHPDVAATPGVITPVKDLP